MFGDPLGAFCSHSALPESPVVKGPLSDLTFAVKDLFDVAGMRTGAGTIDWLAKADVAAEDAPPVAQLRAAGARLVGKTHTDEMAFSLFGRNAHYGTPTNPAAPDRVPGGSSSGSAVAVAGHLADVALGTDTGGSVRIPASFCGIFGIRPTHGVISTERLVPLAASFDTVGWFARDAATLGRVGEALLPAGDPPPFTGAIRALDLFERAEPAVSAALSPMVAKLQRHFGGMRPVRLSNEGLNLWLNAMRTLQGREAWVANGPWVRRDAPRFGPDIQERLQGAAALTDAAVEAALPVRQSVRDRMSALFAQGEVICLPTSGLPAPSRAASYALLDAYRAAIIPFTCVAGLAGLPQVNIPAGFVDGAPVGLSLLGPRGSDRALIALAETITG
jgi:amidase